MIKILHVEESREDLELTKARLRDISDQISIDSAESVSEALDALKRMQYDCILCDYQMPKITGLELLKQLRNEDNQIPFILLTGHGNEDVAIEALRCGADDYFTKEAPVTDYKGMFKSILRTVEAHRFKVVKTAVTEAQNKERSKVFSLLEDLPSPVMLLDQNKSILFANKFVSDMFGSTKGKTCHELILGSKEPCEKCPLDSVLATKARTDVELVTPDGGYYQANYFYFEESNGLSQALMLGIDISERKSVEAELAFRTELERLIAGLSTRFINLPIGLIDTEFRNALEAIGRFAGVDRAYAFIFSEDIERVERVHEWCKEGMDSQGAKLEGTNPWSFPWLMERISSLETVNIPDVAVLPPEAKALKQLTDSAGTRSFVQVPMACEGRLVGSISIASARESKSWSEESVSLLRVVGDMFANALQRKRDLEALRDSERRYKNISETMSDYTFSVRVTPEGKHEREWVAGAFESITGFKPDELDQDKGWSSLMHPDDLPAARDNLRLLHADKAVTFESRIVTKAGETRWVRYYGRPEWDEKEKRIVRIVGGVRDITEMRLAEKALKESEARYKALSELASDYSFSILIMPDGNLIREWDAGPYADITGYKREELSTQDWMNAIFPDDLPKAKEQFQDVLRGNPKEAELRIVTKQGEVRWVRIYARPVWSEEEERVVRFFGTMKDITERKVAEEALRESEEQHRMLSDVTFDYTFSMTVELDGRMKREWIEGAFTKITGYELDELDEYAGFETLVHPEELLRVKDLLTSVLSGNSEMGEIRIVTKSGETRWARFYVRPMKDEREDRIVRIIGATQDITELKLAEETLKKSEKRYRAISEITSDFAYSLLVTPEGKLEREWTAGADTEITGYETGELDPNTWIELAHPDDTPKVRDHLQKLLSGKSDMLEIRFFKKSGEMRWIRIQGRPEWDKAEGRVIRIVGAIRDITERKKMEEALRVSEGRYRAVSELTSDFTFCQNLDSDGKLYRSWVSGAYEKITGYRLDELDPHESWKKIIPPHEKDNAEKYIRSVLSGDTEEGELRIRTKSGEIRLVQFYSRPIWDDKKTKIIGLIGAAKDISEQKKAEEALKRSREWFRSVFEGSRDAVFIVGKDSRFVSVNKATEELTGYSVEELERMSIPDLHDKEDLGAYKAFFKKIMAGESVLSEAKIRRKDGNKVDVEFSNSKIAIGEAAYMHTVARDVTERKKAEEALRQAEERYRELVEKAGLAIAVDDRKGNFKYFNKKFADLFGYTEEEMKHQSLATIAHPDDLETLIKMHKERIRGKRGPERYEFRGVRKDGSTIYVDVEAVPVKEGKKIVGTSAYIWDISARKRAEMAVLESESRYRAVSELASDYAFSIRIDPDGKLTREWVTGAFTRITGYEPDGFDSNEWQSLVLPEDIPVSNNFFENILAGKPSVSEWRIISKSGEIRWVLVQANPEWSGSEDRVIRFIGATQDVTERKLAEEALKKSERNFIELLNASHDVKYKADFKKKRFEYVSPSVEKITGYSAEEIAAMGVDEQLQLVHPDDFEHVAQHSKGLYNGTVGEDVETSILHRVLHKDGHYIWMRDHRTIIRDEEGKPISGLGTVVDVTDRKLHEDEQNMSVKILNLTQTAQSAGELMAGLAAVLREWLGCDAVGIRLKRGADYPYFETVGFTEEFVQTESRLSAVDKWGKSILDEDGKPVLECMCGNVISGRYDPRKPFFTENGIFWTNNAGGLPASKDLMCDIRGTCFRKYESVALVPLRLGGETVGLLQFCKRQKNQFIPKTIGVLERICNTLTIAYLKKLAEEELNKSSENLKEKTIQLAAANKELRAFSYSVAHDLQAPLRHINGFSKILIEDHYDKLDEEARRYVESINRSGIRMNQLIEDLLKLSKVTQNRLQQESVDLSSVVKAVAKRLGQSEPERKVNFIVAPEAKADCDMHLACILIENLLGNAWKFTSNNPDATIEFGSEVLGEETVFFVRDNGVGFDMQMSDKLFIPFQRLHKLSEFEGSGIGLATVKRIVTRHGGRVWAESEPGKGATFYFSFK